MTGNKFEISNFVCPECGNKFPLPRPKSMRRGKGHIKDLYCPFCKKVVKTTEIRPRDFVEMYDGSRFY